MAHRIVQGSQRGSVLKSARRAHFTTDHGPAEVRILVEEDHGFTLDRKEREAFGVVIKTADMLEALTELGLLGERFTLGGSRLPDPQPAVVRAATPSEREQRKRELDEANAMRRTEAGTQEKIRMARSINDANDSPQAA